MSGLAPLAAFELRRAAVRNGAALGLVLFAAVLALGHWDHWRGNAPVEEGGLFVYAHLLGAIALIRFGLAADRRLRFDEYLVVNHVRPGVYVAAKIGAMAALLLAFGAVAALLELILSGGGVERVVWLAVTMTLFAWLVAPFAMLVESRIDTEIPVAPVLLAYGVALFVGYLATGSTVVADVPGISMLAPGNWRSLERLTLSSLLGGTLGFVAVGALTRFTLRRY